MLPLRNDTLKMEAAATIQLVDKCGTCAIKDEESKENVLVGADVNIESDKHEDGHGQMRKSKDHRCPKTKAVFDKEKSKGEQKEDNVSIIIFIDLQADIKPPNAMEVGQKCRQAIRVRIPSFVQLKKVQDHTDEDKGDRDDKKMYDIDLGRLLEDHPKEINDHESRAPSHHAEQRKNQARLVPPIQALIFFHDYLHEHVLNL
ncbi:hypothetical protein [Oligoflexus sp.]|uniref:hypothetical protein n=1 Tax=Oligoflexus sp. TaxID=1971216 RepID=UPI002D76F46F|nr:hypothetical protein [Oligoflexus sp.]